MLSVEGNTLTELTSAVAGVQQVSCLSSRATKINCDPRSVLTQARPGGLHRRVVSFDIPRRHVYRH